MNRRLFTIRRSALYDVGIALAMCAAIIGFLAVAQRDDAHADAQLEQLAQDERARLAEADAHRRAITLAYENGRREALLKACPSTPAKGGT